MISRRFLLKSLILAPVAPAIVRAESLMPVREIYGRSPMLVALEGIKEEVRYSPYRNTWVCYFSKPFGDSYVEWGAFEPTEPVGDRLIALRKSAHEAIRRFIEADSNEIMRNSRRIF